MLEKEGSREEDKREERNRSRGISIVMELLVEALIVEGYSALYDFSRAKQTAEKEMPVDRKRPTASTAGGWPLHKQNCVSGPDREWASPSGADELRRRPKAVILRAFQQKSFQESDDETTENEETSSFNFSA